MSAEINTLLTFLHVSSAVGWMGGAMFMVMVLGPSTAELSPQSRRDLVLKMFPRFIRYITSFATLTLVWGILLAYTRVADVAGLQDTAWGMRISIGAVLAVIAYGLAIGVGLRSARKVLRMAQSTEQGETHAAEMMKLTRRMRLTATSVVILLAVALGLMIASFRI